MYKMKWLLPALALSLPLMAFPGHEPLPLPAFDADLFCRERQVYSVHAGFLYWTAVEGCLDYALKMRHAAWGSSPSFAQGRFENATYDIDPGVRLALIYFRAPHFWELKWQ